MTSRWDAKQTRCGWVTKLKWKKISFIGISLIIIFHIYLALSSQKSQDQDPDPSYSEYEENNDSHVEIVKSFFNNIHFTLPFADHFGENLVDADTNTDAVKDANAGTDADTDTTTTGEGGDELVLDTPTCKIAQGTLWPPQFKNNWDWDSDTKKSPNCDQEKKLFVYVKLDNIIKVTYPNFQNCSIREIIRKPDAPNNNFFIEVNEINLTTTRFVKVAHMEMFRVICDNYTNYEANLPSKPQVEESIDFWNSRSLENYNFQNVPTPTTATKESQINVLWLGIDTISSTHLRRSFPKTLEVFKEMDFVEFNGFHTSGYMTRTNMEAFLMGSTYGMLRRNACNISNEKTWDPCPFIWKDFKARNYVTMFLEDNEGTFNGDADSGFVNAPTDYFLQPMFVAHYHQRKHLSEKRSDCTSTETIPQFLLRQNKRFLQKFRTTPFFSFTWFCYPFHGDEFALPNADGDFANFFKTLQKDPQLLENTLIILNADHGPRYGVYRRNSIDGFLEKSLPPLFMRIPEKLLRKYPHFREFAETNRQRLTTGFDIHHTVLHMLSLSDENADIITYPEEVRISNSSKFEPVLPDRSSLLDMIPDNRTCSTVRVDDELCVCNTHKSSRHVTNPFEVSRMIEHALTPLNTIVNGSKYKDLCVLWEKAGQPLESADVIQQNGDTSTVLLKFETEPSAQFEIQLRITLAGPGEEFNTIETATDPIRLSSYGDTTWCIPDVLVDGKRMKEYCHCKGDPPKKE